MTPPLARSLGWLAEGTDRVESAVAALSDAELGETSGLPGWRRTHVVAHLARNADALGNLLDWAATGVPNPMYADPEQRQRDIDTGAAQPLPALRDDLLAADKRLADALAALPDPAWRAGVRSAKGRDIPATEVPWLRVREVWVHLADLHCGRTMRDLPADLVAALLDDATATLGRNPATPPVTLVSHAGRWATGPSPATTVTGSPEALLGWLIGRDTGADLDPGATELPVLPPWL